MNSSSQPTDTTETQVSDTTSPPMSGDMEKHGSLDNAIELVKGFVKNPRLATSDALMELLMDLQDLKGEEGQESQEQGEQDIGLASQLGENK